MLRSAFVLLHRPQETSTSVGPYRPLQLAAGPEDRRVFVLRIEDTDKERSTDAHTQVILDGLTWLGITWTKDRTSRASMATGTGPTRSAPRRGQGISLLLHPGRA
jgi:hypothetical protein